jgi:hypothetical protein
MIGMVPYSEVIQEADLRQVSLVQMIDEGLKAAFNTIYRALSAAFPQSPE